MIVIVNYGVGNLYSVKKAFETFDKNIIISNKPWDIQKADKIVLPGVGHFKDVMEAIKNLGLFEALIEAGKNKPILGICLGMQVLFEESREGDTQGLSILKGRVIRFPNLIKVPHIGWNRVRFSSHPIFQGIPENPWFYFIHSYYPVPEEDVIIGRTNYGDIEFASAVSCDNIVGFQFHPEKSSEIGLGLIENFVRWK
ncbi:MAG: imidazole glycerol phosphate synthase subunit HisH [bacterium]